MNQLMKSSVEVAGIEYTVKEEDSELDLTGTQIIDLTPLAGMPVELLYLGDTQVSDLTPLAGMQLMGLWIWGTQIDDLTPLAGMPLKWLSFGETQVSDLTPLVGMPLRWLELDDTPAAKKPLPEALQQRVDDAVLTVYGLEGS